MLDPPRHCRVPDPSGTLDLSLVTSMWLDPGDRCLPRPPGWPRLLGGLIPLSQRRHQTLRAVIASETGIADGSTHESRHQGVRLRGRGEEDPAPHDRHLASGDSNNAAADYKGKSCRVALRCLGRRPRGTALRRDGDRFGAGSRGPPHNLDGISSGTLRTRPLDAGPTLSWRPMRDDESSRGGRVNVHIPVATGVNARARTHHWFQSVASRSARAASMAIAASGRSSSMACSSAPLRISPRTPSGPAVTLAARGWPRSSESSPT